MNDESQQKTLIILNDPPYGSERSYNGLRLAGILARNEFTEVKVFLIGDAVACVRAGQDTPRGRYNVERMVRLVANQGGEVSCCGSCMDARGLGERALTEGVHRNSLDELASWTRWADKVIVF
jgi:uncharacterized protein involved in oxidation of intracellular sulfur